VVDTFYTLLERTWDVVDADVRLSERFGIPRQDFLDAMRTHIGGADQGEKAGGAPVLSSVS
jgi:hypothetical protein